MTNAELAAYLNDQLGLSGSAVVTVNVLRQWVLWDVLPKAAGRGRGRGQGLSWDRNERDLRRARQLTTWRAFGVRRESALIVHAYVAWGYGDWERVRDALVAELAIARATVRKRITTDFDFASFNDVAAARKKAFRTQLGPLDSRLESSAFKLSSEFYGLTGKAALLGGLTDDRLGSILASTVSTTFPITLGFDGDLCRIFAASIAGMFAFEDEVENAAISSIKKCSQLELRRARILLRSITKARAIDRSSHSLPEPLGRFFDILDDLGPGIAMGLWLVVNVAMAIRLYQVAGNALVNLSVNSELPRGLKRYLL